MSIKNTALAEKANSVYNLKSGDLYFFNDYFISEINEGVNISQTEVIEVINLVHKHFGFNKPYGLISHHLKPYSIDLIDILPLKNEFQFLFFNAVVAYSDITLKNFEIEKQMLGFKGKIFRNMEAAVNWTSRMIKKAKSANVGNSYLS